MTNAQCTADDSSDKSAAVLVLAKEAWVKPFPWGVLSLIAPAGAPEMTTEVVRDIVDLIFLIRLLPCLIF